MQKKPRMMLHAALGLAVILVLPMAAWARQVDGTKPAPPAEVAPAREAVAGANDLPTGVVAVLGEKLRHWDVFRTLAYSPDGSVLVSGSDDGLIHLHDPETGAVRGNLTDQPDEARRVRRRVSGAYFDLDFSPDGRALIAAGGNRSIRRWQTSDWTEVDSLTGHQEGVFAARFATGSEIASASDDQTLRIWDPGTGETSDTISLPGGYFSALAASPEGGLLAAGLWDQTIRIYDRAERRLERTLRGHDSRPLSLAFSPDGSRLASGDANGTIRLWDTEAWVELASVNDHKGPVLRLAFSPDGTALATAGADGTLRLFEVASSGPITPLRVFDEHEGPVLSLAFHPAGTHLASGGVDAVVRVRGLDAVVTAGVAPIVRPGPITTAAYAPDNATVATGDASGFVRVWYADTGQIRLSFPAHCGRVGAVAFSPDGRVLATGGNEGLVRLWNSESGALIATLEGHADLVAALAFHPDGSTLASAGRDRTFRLWDLADHSEVWTKPGHTGAITSITISPDGQSLATAGKDRHVRIWDASEGRLRAEVPPDMGAYPETVAFSPDSRIVLAGGFSSTINLYDAATGQVLRELGRHRGQTLGVDFLPDGERFVSSGEDGAVRLWPTAGGSSLGVFQLHAPRGTISRLAVSPSGDRFVTVNGDGTAFIVDLAAAEPESEPGGEDQ